MADQHVSASFGECGHVLRENCGAKVQGEAAPPSVTGGKGTQAGAAGVVGRPCGRPWGPDAVTEEAAKPRDSDAAHFGEAGVQAPFRIIAEEAIVPLLAIHIVVAENPAHSDPGIENAGELLPERHAQVEVAENDHARWRIVMAGPQEGGKVAVRIAVEKDVIAHVRPPGCRVRAF